jgi:hypothetical protein
MYDVDYRIVHCSLLHISGDWEPSQQLCLVIERIDVILCLEGQVYCVSRPLSRGTGGRGGSHRRCSAAARAEKTEPEPPL